MPTDIDPTQLLEAGFSLECSKYADTPLRRGDQLLCMDTAGHVLIARAPIEKRDA